MLSNSLTNRKSLFRPCIDLHDGLVKQIVGLTLVDNEEGSDSSLRTNFVAEMTSADFASMYASDNVPGGHVIMLGRGNESAAKSALGAYRGGLQVGGGITADNALEYLEAGASHVIVTSYVFKDGEIDLERLHKLVDLIGKERLVLDLSCRKRLNSATNEYEYVVVTDRWQRFTNFVVNERTLTELSQHCDEFLVHGVDVEGMRQGVDAGLVELLGKYSPIICTYAGGVRSMEDINLVQELGRGRLDVCVGSALDIFGGTLPYKDLVRFNHEK